MALIGVSLIIASVVLFCLRRPAWLHDFTANLRQQLMAPGANRQSLHENKEAVKEDAKPNEPQPIIQEPPAEPADAPSQDSAKEEEEEEEEEEEQTTPTASATKQYDRVPSFLLSESPASSRLSSSAAAAPLSQSTISLSGAMPPSSIPISVHAPTTMPTPSSLSKSASDLMPPPPPPVSISTTNTTTTTTSASKLTPGLMAPPPQPSISRRIPTLAPTPSTSSSLPSMIPNRSRLPVPNRGPASSSLAPPPTHSSVPKKPSKQVTLTPGHSPMDWARLAQSPTSDLRNLPPATPYLKVTPSMLKKMTGRRGKDAWCALGGKVYNVTPYVPFHPGGEAELLRGAGRDGTRMFGEVHPWVNYETMLSACLIGILVDEHEAGNNMEEMD